MFEIDFTMVPFWVQLHGLLLDTKNTRNAAKIMSQMGEVLEVENPMEEGNIIRTFIFLLVNISELSLELEFLFFFLAMS